MELNRYSCQLSRAALQAEALRDSFIGPAPGVSVDTSANVRLMHTLLTVTSDTQQSALETLIHDVNSEIQSLESQFEALCHKHFNVRKGDPVQADAGDVFIAQRVTPLVYLDGRYGLSIGGRSVEGKICQLVLDWDITALSGSV